MNQTYFEWYEFDVNVVRNLIVVKTNELELLKNDSLLISDTYGRGRLRVKLMICYRFYCVIRDVKKMYFSLLVIMAAVLILNFFKHLLKCGFSKNFC